MQNQAKLRVLFGGKPDNDIVSALKDLQIEVKVQNCGAVEPENVPLPLAEYVGQSHVHEYGREAVLGLIEDVRKGKLL